jgi:hypothetical protein
MSNTDTNTPNLRAMLVALFGPTTYTALRYALASIAPLLALFGITGLTSGKIESIVTYAQTFGTAMLAILTLLGIAIPMLMAILGVLTSTIKKQIARVRELAANPDLANEEAQKAIVDATKALAGSTLPQSMQAVQSLVDATIALPQVRTIVTTDAVASASPSDDVVSEKNAVFIAK